MNIYLVRHGESQGNVDASLIEQQFGLFDGVPDEELPTRYPDPWNYYDLLTRFHGRFWAKMPMGESRFDVARRIHQFFSIPQRDKDHHCMMRWLLSLKEQLKRELAARLEPKQSREP